MLTRSLIVKRKGKRLILKTSLFKSLTVITTIGVAVDTGMIFSFQGNVILENPLHIVLIGIPLILQTSLWILQSPMSLAGS